METLQTQDVNDDYSFSDDENHPQDEAWGRLFPLGESFIAVGELVSEV